MVDKLGSLDAVERRESHHGFTLMPPIQVVKDLITHRWPLEARLASFVSTKEELHEANTQRVTRIKSENKSKIIHRTFDSAQCRLRTRRAQRNNMRGTVLYDIVDIGHPRQTGILAQGMGQRLVASQAPEENQGSNLQ